MKYEKTIYYFIVIWFILNLVGCNTTVSPRYDSGAESIGANQAIINQLKTAQLFARESNQWTTSKFNEIRDSAQLISDDALRLEYLFGEYEKLLFDTIRRLQQAERYLNPEGNTVKNSN